MPEAAKTETPDDMPPVTPEAVAIRVAISAFLKVIGPKKGNEFLEEMAALYSDDAEMANILPIRSAKEGPAVEKARRQSFTWFLTVLPLFKAAVRRR